MWRNSEEMKTQSARTVCTWIVHISISLFLSVSAFAGEGRKKRLAILPVNNRTAFPQASDLVADKIYSIFTDMGSYRVLERAQIKRVLEEINFTHSGYVKEDEAIEIGQLSGAELVVLANVNSATLSEHVTDYGLKFTSSVNVGIRLLNLRTGTVIASYDASESTHWPSGSAPKALRKAVDKAMEEIREKVLGEVQYEAVILTYHDKIATVDKGLEDGLRRKQKVLLVREMEVRHPVTGERITTKEIIGEGKVERVTETSAKVKLKVKKEGLDKHDIRPGDRIVWQPEVDD